MFILLVEKWIYAVAIVFFFNYYLSKINRNPNFLKNINSLDPSNWLKVPKKRLKVLTRYREYQDEWPKAASPWGWFSQVTGLLFHTCRSCIENMFEITGAANDLSLQEVFSKRCASVWRYYKRQTVW